MIRDRKGRFFNAQIFNKPQRAIDILLTISFLYISLQVLLDYKRGGQPYKQGDWLINNLGGDIRRGHLGSAIIYISDILGSSPLLIVVLIQIITLLVLFITFRLLTSSISSPLVLVLLVISPAIFTIFWVADSGGSVRKELLVFAGLSLCALGTVRKSPVFFWPGVLFLCIGFVSHEAQVLFVPTFLGILFISGLFKTTPKQAFTACVIVFCAANFSIYFSLKNSQALDTTLICAPLIERGLDRSICDGAITWLGNDITYGFQRVITRLNPIRLVGFLISYIAALAPFIYLITISRHSMKGVIALFATALPFVPLYIIAVDWGRWMSFHVFSMTILVVCAMKSNKIRLNKEPSSVYIFSLVALSLIVSPKHTIGIRFGGVLERLAVDLWNTLI